jgi:hypothetical protein
MTKGVGSTCLMAWVKQLVTQGNKANRPRESHAQCTAVAVILGTIIVNALVPTTRTTASTAKLKFQKKKLGGEKMCWPHLRVRSLSRGGPEGHCQYPIDRVPPRTGFKTTQGAERASTRCHVS